MATLALGSDDGGETALPTPVSGVLGTILSLGGLLLVTGTITLSVVQLRTYEDRIDELERTQVAPAVTSDAQPADARVAELEAQVARLGDDLSGTRTELADARKMIDGLSGELEACRGQLANPDSRLRELSDQNTRLRRENALLNQRCPPNPGVVIP